MDPQLPQDPAPPAIPNLFAVPEFPVYKDRSTGLLIYGIVEIILGALAALMIPFMLLGAMFSRKMAGGPLPAGSYVHSICSYTLVAALLITLGIGSIRARRWAWALNLILSWVWLIIGAVATVAMTVFVPSLFATGFRQAAAQTPDTPPMPTGVMAVVLTFVIVFFSIFFVVLPIAFLLFYRRKDVEETCKQRDSVSRWTDRCPLPVLAASLMFGSGAVYYLLMSVTTPFLPFFGRYLTGIVATVALLAMAGIEVFLANAFYRLRLAGWWIAVSVIALRMISAILTLRHADLLQAYSKMGWSETRLQQMSANPMLRGTILLWWILASMVLFLGYMLWIKHYFHETSAPGAAEPVEPYLPPAGGTTA